MSLRYEVRVVLVADPEEGYGGPPDMIWGFNKEEAIPAFADAADGMKQAAELLVDAIAEAQRSIGRQVAGIFSVEEQLRREEREREERGEGDGS